jgi:hypothetical protein
MAEINNPMTEVRRELNLRIVNGETDQIILHQITRPLYFLDQYFPPKHLNKALIWLIEHGLIGKNFIAWYNAKTPLKLGKVTHAAGCCGSDLEMHRILLSVVENDVLKPLIAGKNFNQ